MDPEGSKKNSFKLADSVDKGTNTDTMTTSAAAAVTDQSHSSSGTAVWAYHKPIFTAVLVPKQLVSEDEEDDEKTTPLLTSEEKQQNGVSSSSCSEEWLLSTVYKSSLAFGVVVGSFIQASSLGANYILTILFGRDPEGIPKHQQEIIAFSLVWSLVTSIMGLLVLCISRSLLSSAAKGLNNAHMSVSGDSKGVFNPQKFVSCFEFPFAFGALAGVCLCWAGIDLLLGMRSHAYHSLCTLAVAYFAKVLFEVFCVNSLEEDEEDEQDDGSANSLLDHSETSVEEAMNKVHKEFKYQGMAAGALVGFFIQFSSLGASFMIDALSRGNKDLTEPVEMSRERLFLLSLGWSFVFGSMGVAVLLFLRFMVGIVCDFILSKSPRTAEELQDEDEMTDRWAMSLEFFFASGCLIGVNVAWLFTDLGLGLDALVWRSFITLAVAAVWCLVLAYCFGFNEINNTPFRRRARNGKMVAKATQTNRAGLLVV